MKEVILPQLGEGIEGASITCWYFKPGDNVKEGEDLVELATDKAAFNLPCPASGKLSRVLLLLLCQVDASSTCKSWGLRQTTPAADVRGGEPDELAGEGCEHHPFLHLQRLHSCWSRRRE